DLGEMRAIGPRASSQAIWAQGTRLPASLAAARAPQSAMPPRRRAASWIRAGGSLDDLVSAGQQRRWHLKIECFRGATIDTSSNLVGAIAAGLDERGIGDDSHHRGVRDRALHCCLCETAINARPSTCAPPRIRRQLTAGPITTYSCSVIGER